MILTSYFVDILTKLDVKCTFFFYIYSTDQNHLLLRYRPKLHLYVYSTDQKYIRLQYRSVSVHVKSSRHVIRGFPSIIVPCAHTYCRVVPYTVPPGNNSALGLSIGIPQSAANNKHEDFVHCICVE